MWGARIGGDLAVPAGLPGAPRLRSTSRDPEGRFRACPDERRTVNEITRRIEHDVPHAGDHIAALGTTAPAPALLLTLGVLVVGTTASGLAAELVVLLLVGGLPIACAVAAAARVAPMHAAEGWSGLAPRLWTWLTTCAANGCTRHPAHLGWCDEHVPLDDRGPDEYWGDPEDDRN